MIIERSTIKNFKRFADADIHWKTGITGIVGGNGTGKSSIVDSILFTLFGVSSGIIPEHIVSSFATERCGMYLRFRQGSDICEIVRSYSKTKQHSTTLKVNGEIRADGVSQVDAEVRRILGMGPADFRNTVYAAQKDLMTLLDLTPGKRKEWFLRALGIDYLNTGSQKLLKEQIDAKEKEANLLQGELAALSRQDPTEMDQTRTNLTILKNKIASLTLEEQNQKVERTHQFTLLQDHQIKEAKQGKLIDQHNAIRNDITNLSLRAGVFSRQLASTPVNEQDLQRLQEDVDKIPQVRQDIEAYRNKKVESDRIATEQKAWSKNRTAIVEHHDDISAQLAALAKSEVTLAELQAAVRKDLGFDEDKHFDEVVPEYQQYVTEKITNLNARMKSNEDAQRKITANLSTLRQSGPEGTCPICLQRLGDHFADVEIEYAAKIAELTSEYDEMSGALKVAKQDAQKIPNLKPTLERIRDIRIALGYREIRERDLEETATKIYEADAHLQQLAQQLKDVAYSEEGYLSCRQRLVDLEAAQKKHTDLIKQAALQAGLNAQINEINNQIAAKNAALAEVKTAIDNDPIDQTVGPRLQHEVEKLDISLKTISQDLATSIERERTLAQKVTDLELAAAHIGTLQKQLASIREEIEILKLTRVAIAEYVVYVMQVVRARIETEVSSIISEITDGKYNRVLIDDDFNILVRENDKEYAVDRFSGGEQDDIAVALRIALSKYLTGHESMPLFFDEIFGSQDEERRASLLVALRSQKSYFPQILLISHIAEIQGEFENVLIVKSDGPTSSVVEG